MDSEKDLLKQDLSNQEKPEEIKKFIEDAELLGHEDIAELGRKKLQEITEKASSITQTTEAQVAQVESMGGKTEEVTERTKEVDQKIEEVKAEARKEIEEVNQSEVKTIENQKQVELDKIRNQIDSSLDSSPDILASLCREHQKREKEIGEDTFFVTNTVGHYVLKNFDKFSKDKLKGLVTEFLNNDPSYLDQIEKNGGNENVKAETMNSEIHKEGEAGNGALETDAAHNDSIENQDDKELKQKVESLENEFNNINEKVIANWKKFEESGELEKSLKYLDAKEAIENLSKYQLSLDNGLDSWRVVTTKIGDFDDLIQQKAFEFGKEMSDFNRRLMYNEMHHDDNSVYGKRISDIQNKAGSFRLDTNIKQHKELMTLYKQRVSSLK